MKKLLITLSSALLGFVCCACAVSWNKRDFSDIKGTKEKISVLIIGANGSVAKVATQGFLAGTNANLKLYLRNSSRLSNIAKQNPSRVQLIEGDEQVRTIIELEDNPSTRDFYALLPLALKFSDYVGKEKVSNALPKPLNTSELNGYDPQVWDLFYFAQWGNLGIFYAK